MPVVKRSVVPVQLCRGKLPPKCPDDLEAVSINALSGLILQLSSLAKHADALFGEILQDTNDVLSRTTKAQERIQIAKQNLDAMDSKKGAKDIEAANVNIEAYRRKDAPDQQIMTKTPVPRAILETYHNCEPPPALNDMNPYREDGKISLKFYTDPDYFFRLWCEEMRAQTEQQKQRHRRKKKKKQRKGRPALQKKVASVIKREYNSMGAEYNLTPAQQHARQKEKEQSQQAQIRQHEEQQQLQYNAPVRPTNAPPGPPVKPSAAPPPPPGRPTGAPPPPPPSSASKPTAGPPPPPPSGSKPAGLNMPPPPPPGAGGAPFSAPPPPPPASAGIDNESSYEQVTNTYDNEYEEDTYDSIPSSAPPAPPGPPSGAPPGPPPGPPTSLPPGPPSTAPSGPAPPGPPPGLPPAPPTGAPSAPPPPAPMAFTPGAPPPPPAPAAPALPENIYGSVGASGGEGVANSGNDLLDAILNKRLKSVKPEEKERASFSSANRTDVAAILMRRLAVEMSDSDDEYSDEEWSDSEGEES